MSPTAGIGLKADHFVDAIASPAAGLWFEVHPENYMVAGGPRLTMLGAARMARPLSLHGVGLSLAGASGPDPVHLAALKRLVDRFEPFLVSEHLAWSRIGDQCFPDLLPFPRSDEALARIAHNIDVVQSTLGRAVLIENPSHYMAIEGHVWSEADFLRELARRTGCGLLLDINNVAVSAHNLGFDANAYLADFPVDMVGEIHLAGYAPDGATDLLIDGHNASIAEDVWALYAGVVDRIGACPTLIERDANLPSFSELLDERNRADGMLQLAQPEAEDA
jgi:uncharacterized protein